MWKNSKNFFVLITGPRYRRPKEKKEKGGDDEKRPRTAFSNEQLIRLKVGRLYYAFTNCFLYFFFYFFLYVMASHLFTEGIQ